MRKSYFFRNSCGLFLFFLYFCLAFSVFCIDKTRWFSYCYITIYNIGSEQKV